MSVELSHEPLVREDVFRELSGPEAGAIVVFLGCVRATENGRRIAAIRYEAYREMAEKTLGRLERRASERFAARVLVRHRLGEVPVLEPSLIVACAAAHRAQAFEAARWIVERIKKDVPIWKVEFS